MRIERRDRDARLGDARLAHHAIDQLDRIGDAVRIDAVERLAQRLMPGDARHPLPVEHVHLGEIGLVAEQAREHLVLVGEFPAAVEHRALVQRREGDGIDLARLGEVDRARQRLAGQPAGFRAGLAERE